MGTGTENVRYGYLKVKYRCRTEHILNRKYRYRKRQKMGTDSVPKKNQYEKFGTGTVPLPSTKCSSLVHVCTISL
ncbi:hypothetical protein HanIR_Chr07g0326131 [Helianthus annuus]|nr:hypothetical protein HanIR_Chr07g0326131 [Helianthus annuus]